MESFFLTCGTIDLVPVQEILLHRYSNIDYILNLGYPEGIELIEAAIEAEIETKLWDMYLAKFTLMDENNMVSFEEFKESANSVRKRFRAEDISYLSDRDLMKEVEEINRTYLEQKEGG